MIEQTFNIEGKINNAHNEIYYLRKNRLQYNEMIEKIDEVIRNLKDAKTNLVTAKEKLEKHYSGNGSKEKSKTIEKQISNINKEIEKIRKIILPEAKKQIRMINSKIMREQEEIDQLINVLNKMSDI